MILLTVLLAAGIASTYKKTESFTRVLDIARFNYGKNDESRRAENRAGNGNDIQTYHLQADGRGGHGRVPQTVGADFEL